MSKFCSTANIQVAETQVAEVTVEQYYYRTVTSYELIKKKITVHPCPEIHFKPKTDIEVLYEMIRCGKIDEKALCDLLTGKSSYQRLQIAALYQQKYGKSLISELSKKLSGCFKILVVALLTPPSEYHAAELHDAMKGLGTDEKTLIEIICSANNYQIERIEASYEKLYCKTLEEDVSSDTSASFKKILLLLLQAKRSEDEKVCAELVDKDVSDLIAAGICHDSGLYKVDVIIELLAKRSYAHLRQVFKTCRHRSQHPVQKVIEKKFGGDSQEALLTIIEVIENSDDYFAECIHHAIAGWGTKDRQLIRIIVSRSEVDLKEIIRVYEKNYKTSLAKDIAGDTSGWYKETLLCLVKDNQKDVQKGR